MLLTSCHSVGHSGSMKETMRKIESEGKRKSASCLQEKLKMSFLINVIASCGWHETENDGTGISCV